MCDCHWTELHWFNSKPTAQKHYKSVPGERKVECKSFIERKEYPVMLKDVVFLFIYNIL